MPTAQAEEFSIHLLDVGTTKYGDSILCRFGETSILIDGAHANNNRLTTETIGGEEVQHDAIQAQIQQILGSDRAHVDLLVMTHCHSDHVGCLPALVGNETLTCDWALMAHPDLGFGLGENDPAPRDAADMTKEEKLAAALREEPFLRASDQEIEQLIADAAAEYENYVGLLEKLRTDLGERLVLYRGPGEEESPGLESLLSNFQHTGMKVLGPTQAQLVLCAASLKDRYKDAVSNAGDALRAADGSVADAYRSLIASFGDNPDAGGYDQGKALNCQSVVLQFESAGAKVLLTGDMQFSQPGLGAEVKSEMDALIEAIGAEAPYQFVKLAHHGSSNGFSLPLLKQWGARMFGISTGSRSGQHPSPAVLKTLQEQKARWIRTDMNGECSFSITNGAATLKKQRGIFNDATPPSDRPDEEVGSSLLGPPAGGPAQPVPSTSVRAESEDQFVHIHAKIPHVRTKVTITIEVDPATGGKSFDQPAVEQRAGGQSFSKLLFATDSKKLTHNVGPEACQAALNLVRQSEGVLVDSAGESLLNTVGQRLGDGGKYRGVVLLGGYDVVPPRVHDCLDRGLRAEVRRFERLNPRLATKDHDDYTVWSDDAYGADRADLPALPVSRIPDGNKPRLLLKALCASLPATLSSRTGIRNVVREFADGVFSDLSGAGNLLTSERTVYNQAPPYALRGDSLYLMLHGYASNPGRFAGEDAQESGEYFVAMTVDNVPDPCPSVVFTGCCWGALIADTRAIEFKAGMALGTRSPDQSIALRCLANGANAFLGCTGSHYSPREKPYNFYGAPFHKAFWKHASAGSPPSLALWEAKRDYAKLIPCRPNAGPIAYAIEQKLLRQYTCLGLGWPFGADQKS